MQRRQQIVQVIFLFYVVADMLSFNSARVARSFCQSVRHPKFNSRLYSTNSPVESLPEWFPSEILSNERDGETLRTIRIQVDPSVQNLYSNPGQYVKMKIGDSKPSFFAIASAPSTESGEFFFLVKESESNAFLTSIEKGAKVDMSIPMGKGFQVEEYLDKYKMDFPTCEVLLFACGSGLAPIAAAIDSGKLQLKTTGYMSLFERKAILYVGAKTPNHLPLRHRYEEWEQKGVKVVPVLSRVAGENGGTGYVQDLLKEKGVRVPKNTAALLCGMRGMTDNVKELLLDAGVFEGRILFNF